MEPIILYSQPDCVPCEITKKYFQDQGIKYIEKNVKQDKQAYNELIKKYKSYSTPTVVIGDQVFSGFKLNEIEQALFGEKSK
ncbi:glutaredoxin family protein [Caldibacillus thermolactis]|jgi:glutaredoxin-like YruB-family protein|uniref:Glutaredoxin family protein n=1 Tax=Pallidibacillus thermolactis TaxID=251051 RepID=A0ABT2WGU8_9BACI|nr:glutaredoxin family protein [Pallidibacillus thermolactis]MCU9594701.1 glutaredoxin family protein [Pallidibacillus thermolactis]MCU9600419.1 glutaredoxin family protein [Pallidibacillus thermolactis subsp. kokeshiiformis]MED1672135.1 glutaredoxin family protein [Pallidibacillus thermolactis subsp. kokeshiiformis]